MFLSYFITLVVIWCNLLGDLCWWEDSICWCRPSLTGRATGEWKETGQTKKCCLLCCYVSYQASYSVMYCEYPAHLSTWADISYGVPPLQSKYFRLFTFTCRYSIMQSCWHENPAERPSFSELVNLISKALEPLADYLDITAFSPGVAAPTAPTSVIDTEQTDDECNSIDS